MRHLTTQLGLICASLMLSASGAWALPKCPDDPNAYWSNCVGTITFANGDIYVGEWRDNKRNGQGTYTFANGDIYVGEYKDDKRNGQGTVTYASGSTYVGRWRDDKRNGQGTHTWPDGEKYVGEWLDDNMHGQGTRTYANGTTYVGEWLDDKRNGQGTFTNAAGTIIEGIWENDLFKYANIAEPPVVSEAKPQDDEVREAASGSGFAVSSDGYVITNNHVIEGCQEVAVYDGGRAVPVTVITYDPQNDLALLKGDFTPKTVFALSGDQPELLQDVYVAGYPFGNEISSSIKVTKGIISSLTGIGNNFSNVQIDAALQVGNSGGPILDEMGNVIGVAVAKLDAKYMYDNFGSIPENTNFGIRSSVVRNILDSNGISSLPPNRSEIARSELGKMITGGTYYVSCLMTLAQIEVLKTKKVMYDNLR
jgi:S1-C subfamily serine protease